MSQSSNNIPYDKYNKKILEKKGFPPDYYDKLLRLPNISDIKSNRVCGIFKTEHKIILETNVD